MYIRSTRREQLSMKPIFNERILVTATPFFTGCEKENFFFRIASCELQVKTNKHSLNSFYFSLLSLSPSRFRQWCSVKKFFPIFSHCDRNCIFEVLFLVDVVVANSKLHFTNTRIMCQKVIVTFESRSF